MERKVKSRLWVPIVILAVTLGIAFLAHAAPNVKNYLSSPAAGTTPPYDNFLVLGGTVESGTTKLPTTASFSVGAEASNHIDVQITLKDGGGTAIAFPYETYCWVSESSVGAGYVTTAGTSALSAITNGYVESVTTGKSANSISSAAGLLGVRVSQTSATVPNEYLCCKLSLGSTSCSGVIDFN